MADLTIAVASHHFTVACTSPKARQFLYSFSKRFIQWGQVKENGLKLWRPIKTFRTENMSKTFYRFHINSYENFKEALANDMTTLKVDTLRMLPPVGQPISFQIKSHYSDLEHQGPIIDYLTKPLPKSKLVVLQTGKGKGYCEIKALSIIGKRILGVLRPKYLMKWVEELVEKTNITVEDILVVRGSDELRYLLNMAEEETFSAKAILISADTLREWITIYEKFGEEIVDLGYACYPQDLCQHLQVGVRLIDEVHENFHFNFKLDLYTNVEQTHALSATVDPDDPFIDRMTKVMFPVEDRYKGQPYHKYVESVAALYQFQNPNKIQSKEFGSTNYSHHAVEKSIIRLAKFVPVLKNYFDMMDYFFKGYFFDDYLPGEKCFFYFISIDMCTRATEYFKEKYPQLKVGRFVEDDPESNLYESDIIITSMQKAGTGFDIPGLKTVFLTIAMSTTQGNVQGLGRLRELKNDVRPKFVYFVCTDIKKHIDYHEKKKDILKNKALTYKPHYYNRKI